MKKVKLIQGTRAWEEAKETRIGSSDIFDIIRYYATEQELLNCGINPQEVMDEKPFITTWALYHKILRDGLYQVAELDPQFAEYGLAMEAYGRDILQQGREYKLRRGSVYANDKCIASLDIEGMSEKIDVRPFDYGIGSVPFAEMFICEQKTLYEFKDKLPIKYIIQAQYQLTMTKKRFFILQAMVLKNDTPFERGKITALINRNLKATKEYLNGKVTVHHFYFDNNAVLSVLIQKCLKRFFDDVEARREPRAFIEHDSQKNIILALRSNSFYNDKMVLESELISIYKSVKEGVEHAESARKLALQMIIDEARENNVSRFKFEGLTAMFDARGAFLLREPKDGAI